MGRKTKDSGVDGLLVVDKPAGWTSHDVVAKCRGVFAQRRAGHSGTLDPDATGVLLIGFGQATKLLSLLTVLPKRYTGEVVLGSATSTLDSSGDVLHTYDMGGITLAQMRTAAAGFVGDIEQIPPMVSAVQVGGVRLHELARQGIEIERTARPVHVYRYDVTGEVEPGVFSIDVTCSSGTYVRTLAADVGAALGGGAHLRNLRRVSIGSFGVDEGAPVDEHLGERTLLTPASALRDYPAAMIDDEVLVAQIRNGRVLPRSVFAVVTGGTDVTGVSGVSGASGGVTGGGGSDVAVGGGSRPWAVLDRGGALLAVYEAHGEDMAKPLVVLTR